MDRGPRPAIASLAVAVLAAAVQAGPEAPRPGVAFKTQVTLDGAARTLDLLPHSVRAADYRVYHVDADGAMRETAPGPVNTFRGSVAGFPGSVVAAALLRDGLHARIVLASGAVYELGPASADAGPPVAQLHGHREPPDGGAGPLFVADLGIDADFQYFQRWGERTEERINLIINFINVQYERDVDITHRISALIVRRSPTYTTNDAARLLEQFRQQWLNEHGEIPRDLAHLFTGRNLNGGVIGLAYLGGTVCTDRSFCLVAAPELPFACTTDLSAHELGFLWGAFTCNCPGTTMNGSLSCANRFAQESIEQIVEHRDSRDCLELDGACPEDLDASGAVDFADLVRLLATWGPCAECPEDLDGDGAVGFGDLVRLLARWGPCP